MTPEEEILYTRCRALTMLDEAMSKTVLEEARAAIRAAVEQQRQKDAEIARGNEACPSRCPFDKQGFTLPMDKPCPACKQTGYDARQGSACLEAFPRQRIADAIEAQE